VALPPWSTLVRLHRVDLTGPIDCCYTSTTPPSSPSPATWRLNDDDFVVWRQASAWYSRVGSDPVSVSPAATLTRLDRFESIGPLWVCRAPHDDLWASGAGHHTRLGVGTAVADAYSSTSTTATITITRTARSGSTPTVDIVGAAADALTDHPAALAAFDTDEAAKREFLSAMPFAMAPPLVGLWAASVWHHFCTEAESQTTPSAAGGAAAAGPYTTAYTTAARNGSIPVATAAGLSAVDPPGDGTFRDRLAPVYTLVAASSTSGQASATKTIQVEPTATKWCIGNSPVAAADALLNATSLLLAAPPLGGA